MSTLTHTHSWDVLKITVLCCPSAIVWLQLLKLWVFPVLLADYLEKCLCQFSCFWELVCGFLKVSSAKLALKPREAGGSHFHQWNLFIWSFSKLMFPGLDQNRSSSLTLMMVKPAQPGHVAAQLINYLSLFSCLVVFSHLLALVSLKMPQHNSRAARLINHRRPRSSARCSLLQNSLFTNRTLMICCTLAALITLVSGAATPPFLHVCTCFCGFGFMWRVGEESAIQQLLRWMLTGAQQLLHTTLGPVAGSASRPPHSIRPDGNYISEPLTTANVNFSVWNVKWKKRVQVNEFIIAGSSVWRRLHLVLTPELQRSIISSTHQINDDVSIHQMF